MSFVNVSVVCLSSKRTLLPWNIVRASKSEHSLRGFYYSSIQTHIASTSELSYGLVHVEVGTSKEKMDKVGLELPIILGEEFKNVKIRDHACGDTIKKLYYSVDFEPIYVYYGI